MLSLAHALAALITVAAVVPAAPNDSDGRAATPLAPVVEELRAARGTRRRSGQGDTGRTVGTAVGSGGPPPSEHRGCTRCSTTRPVSRTCTACPSRAALYPHRNPSSSCTCPSARARPGLDLARFGYTHFSLGLPASLATTAAWQRERQVLLVARAALKHEREWPALEAARPGARK